MTRKTFAVPDSALWDELKQAIQPLNRRKALKSKPRLIEGSKLAVSKPVIWDTTENLVVAKQRPSNQPPAISSFDRRTAQRLGRGNVEPEARIDLHGENLETARYALLNFVFRQRQMGNRLVRAPWLPP